MAMATGMRTRVRVSNWRVRELSRRVWSHSIGSVGPDARPDRHAAEERPGPEGLVGPEAIEAEDADEAHARRSEQAATDAQGGRRHRP